jgi:hypothetical protein
MALFHHRSLGQWKSISTRGALKLAAANIPFENSSTAFGALHPYGQSNILEIVNTTILVRKSTEKVFEQHRSVFFHKSSCILAIYKDIYFELTKISTAITTQKITVSEAVQAYIAAGVPKNKLCLGMPFYGRGDHSNTILDKFMKTGYTGGLYEERWDSIGKVPYLVDWSGQLVWSAENPRSIAAKCQYILDQDLLGGMYWETTEDDAQLDLMNTVYLSLMKNMKGSVPLKHVLLMTGGVDNNEVQYMISLGRKTGFDVTEYHVRDIYVKGSFDHYHLLCNLGLDMDSLCSDAKADFQKYIDDAHGSYMAVNADTTKTWKWYNDFYRHDEKKNDYPQLGD